MGGKRVARGAAPRGAHRRESEAPASGRAREPRDVDRTVPVVWVPVLGGPARAGCGVAHDRAIRDAASDLALERAPVGPGGPAPHPAARRAAAPRAPAR